MPNFDTFYTQLSQTSKHQKLKFTKFGFQTQRKVLQKNVNFKEGRNLMQQFFQYFFKSWRKKVKQIFNVDNKQVYIKKEMKKGVKKLGNYHIYKETKPQKDEISSQFTGRQILSRAQVTICQIDRKKLNSIANFSQELQRKLTLMKVINPNTFYPCNQVVLTKNHYYIIREKSNFKTLELKKKNPQTYKKQIITLLNTFRKVFKELKKYESYHGHLSQKIIRTQKSFYKFQLLNGMEFNCFKKIMQVRNMKEMKMEGNQWLAYYPPQVFLCKKFSEKTDVWAFGVIVYRQIYGILPWNLQNLTLYEFVYSSVYKQIQFPQQKEKSSKWNHLIYCCLKPDQDLRFCYQDILNSQIFQDFDLRNLTKIRHLKNQKSIEELSSMRTLNSQENEQLKKAIESVFLQ